MLPDNWKSGIKISLDTDLAYSYGKTENLAMEEFLKFTDDYMSVVCSTLQSDDQPISDDQKQALYQGRLFKNLQ